jgi:ketosteroid isomerase-like protein
VSQATGIRVYGDTALVVGSYYLKGAHGGKGYQGEGKFIDTWVLKQGKWVCVVTQGTPVPR